MYSKMLTRTIDFVKNALNPWFWWFHGKCVLWTTFWINLDNKITERWFHWNSVISDSCKFRIL